MTEWEKCLFVRQVKLATNVVHWRMWTTKMILLGPDMSKRGPHCIPSCGEKRKKKKSNVLIFGSGETFSVKDQRLDEILPNAAHFLTIKTHSACTKAQSSHVAVKMWSRKHHGLINTDECLLIIYTAVFHRICCPIITCSSAKYCDVCVPNSIKFTHSDLEVGVEAVKSLMGTHPDLKEHVAGTFLWFYQR